MRFPIMFAALPYYCAVDIVYCVVAFFIGTIAHGVNYYL